VQCKHQEEYDTQDVQNHQIKIVWQMDTSGNNGYLYSGGSPFEFELWNFLRGSSVAVLHLYVI